MYDFKKTYNIISEILSSLNSFEHKFITNLDKEWDNIIHKYNVSQETIDGFGTTYTPVNIIHALLFGDYAGESMITVSRKVDYNKNKNVLKQLLFNTFGISGAADIVTFTIREFDELLGDVFSKFELLYQAGVDEKENLITSDEVSRLYDMIAAFSFESGHNRFDSSTIKTFVSSLEKHTNIPNLAKDTLKRYYFNDVYELKNNLRIFETNNMFYGETNNIMRFFNRLYNYAFGDIICIYYTLRTIFDNFINTKSK